jgi:HSP20 family molecular chaperone IbpA
MDSASIDSSRRRAISHRLTETEKEAAKRIASAQDEVRRAQEDSSRQIDQIRDEFSRSRESEAARFEGTYQAQKDKGYSRIRELEKAQDAELQRVKKEGERLLQSTLDHYARAVDHAERDGNRKLEDTRKSLTHQIGTAERQSGSELQDLRTQHQTQVRQIRENQEAELSRYSKLREQKVNEAREQSEGTVRHTEEHYRQNLSELMRSQQAVLDRVQADAAERLATLRQSTTSKLEAYSSRQDDPFYRLKDPQARIEDTGDGYLIRAHIPEHEQEQVKVSIRGQSIVVSGQRRNQEKVERAPGETLSTASFESFSQTLPIQAPVNAKELIRFFEGDELVAWVPKFGNPLASSSFAQAQRLRQLQPEVSPTKPARPDFPKNLPKNTENQPAAPEGPAGKKPGSRPLG